MVSNVVPVDFRNDERNVGVHSKRGGIVDYDGAGGLGSRRMLARDLAAGAEKGELDAIKPARAELLDRNCLVAKLHGFSGRAR